MDPDSETALTGRSSRRDVEGVPPRRVIATAGAAAERAAAARIAARAVVGLSPPPRQILFAADAGLFSALKSQNHLSVPRRAMSVPARRSVKSLGSDAWKRRLRLEVLERVRVQRAAILSRARGDSGCQNADGLRAHIQNGLREILHDALGEKTRGRVGQPEPCAESSDDGMWNDDVAVTRPPNVATPDNATACEPSSSASSWETTSAVLTGERRFALEKEKSKVNVRATWNEIAARAGFSDVEYETLMCEMHRGFDEELRDEEAFLLALELEKMETQVALATESAGEAWEKEKENFRVLAKDSEDHVLCPVCRCNKLLQTRGYIFCPSTSSDTGKASHCVRLSRRDPTSEGADGRVAGCDAFSLPSLRTRLANCYAAHALAKCAGPLRFAMRNFGHGDEMLLAECTQCGFTEVLM